MELFRLLAALGGYGRLLPHARREIDYWEVRAQPDALAREKLRCERRNVESATFFSMLSDDRLTAMRRIVRFQLAYELLDGISEEASTVEESLRLHDALHLAVRGAWIMTVNYDSAYLAELVQSCRVVVTPEASGAMVEAIDRIARAQALNHVGASDRRSRDGLSWWEADAAGISSLDVLAMLATPLEQHEAVLHAYTEVCALSALLDAVVDLPDDERTGNHNWLMHYPSMDFASRRLGELAEIALARLGALDRAYLHRAALAGLMAHNLVKAHEPFRRLALAVPYTRAAMALFGARRLLPD